MSAAAREEHAALLRSWYGQMCLIRCFDQTAAGLYDEGLVRGSLHPYVGMEAGAVGVCAALEPDDYVCTYHRGHGHCLAHGLDPARMMAEILGRRDGYCGGKGGTMHIASVADGVLGSDGVVGGMLPVAVGAAYAARLQGTTRVAVAFFGDGAVNQGVFHEALNLAAVLAAPVVFVCENNLWALSTRSEAVTAGPSIAAKADAYGMPGSRVDGLDPEAVHEVASVAVQDARAGGGPSLIELETYRWSAHSVYATGDPRTAEERAGWEARDPIPRLAARVTEAAFATGAELDRIRAEAAERVAAAARFARDAPEPEPESALLDVYGAHG